MSQDPYLSSGWPDDPWPLDEFEASSVQPPIVPTTTVGRWPLGHQIVVLAVVVAASAFFGYAMYRSVAGVRLSADGLAELSTWSWGLLWGSLATFVAAVLATVCLVRTESSRLVPVIALASALFLPPLALYTGFRVGFDVAAVSVGQDVSTLVGSAGGSAMLTWLMGLFGG